MVSLSGTYRHSIIIQLGTEQCSKNIAIASQGIFQLIDKIKRHVLSPVAHKHSMLQKMRDLFVIDDDVQTGLRSNGPAILLSIHCFR